MNQQYDNTNCGVLFKNDNKTTARHPDYRGTLDVEGKTFWVSGWIKVAGPAARNPGSKFMSLAVTPQAPPSAPVPLDDEDDDSQIPF